MTFSMIIKYNTVAERNISLISTYTAKLVQGGIARDRNIFSKWTHFRIIQNDIRILLKV